jgi:hypothetical protein
MTLAAIDLIFPARPRNHCEGACSNNGDCSDISDLSHLAQGFTSAGPTDGALLLPMTSIPPRPTSARASLRRRALMIAAWCAVDHEHHRHGLMLQGRDGADGRAAVSPDRRSFHRAARAKRRLGFDIAERMGLSSWCVVIFRSVSNPSYSTSLLPWIAQSAAPSPAIEIAA